MDILKCPDPYDTSKIEEGRRIREVEGGWQIINHEIYRQSPEARRALWREQKALQRARKPKRVSRGRELPGEAAYQKALKAGASQEELDRLSAPAEAPGKTLMEVFAAERERGMQEKSGMGEVPRVLTAAQVEMLARAEASGDKVTVQRLRGLLD